VEQQGVDADRDLQEVALGVLEVGAGETPEEVPDDPPGDDAVVRHDEKGDAHEQRADVLPGVAAVLA